MNHNDVTDTSHVTLGKNTQYLGRCKCIFEGYIKCRLSAFGHIFICCFKVSVLHCRPSIYNATFEPVLHRLLFFCWHSVFIGFRCGCYIAFASPSFKYYLSAYHTTRTTHDDVVFLLCHYFIFFNCLIIVTVIFLLCSGYVFLYFLSIPEHNQNRLRREQMLIAVTGEPGGVSPLFPTLPHRSDQL